MNSYKNKKANTNQQRFHRHTKPVSKFFQIELTEAFKIYLQQQGIDPKTASFFKRHHCFGMSICFSVFFLEKKHKWWTSLLQAIVNNRARFTKIGYLDEIADDWHLPQQEQIQTRRQLIERVLNYVIISQAMIEILPDELQANIKYSHYRQNTYLDTPKMLEKDKFYNHDLFLHEHISKTGQLFKIQSSESISAHFSKILLHKTIELCDFENSISLISVNGHSCALVYNKRHKQFGYYNPSASRAKACWFKNKEDLVNAIFAEENSTSVSFTLLHASAEPNRVFFQNFKQLVHDPATFNELFPSQVSQMLINYSGTLAQRVFAIQSKTNKNFFPDSIKAIIKELHPFNKRYPQNIEYTIIQFLYHKVITGKMYHQLLEQLDAKLFDGKSLLFHLASKAPITLCYMFLFQKPPHTRKSAYFFSTPQKIELFPLLSKRLEDGKTLQEHLTPYCYFVLAVRCLKPAAIFLGISLLLLKTLNFTVQTIEHTLHQPAP